MYNKDAAYAAPISESKAEVAYLAHTQDVGGSNPSSPTINGQIV